MQQPGEPSVEEILDSIKKVIARDSREIATTQRKRNLQNMASEAEVEPVGDDEAEEILELDEDAMVSLEEAAGEDAGDDGAADRPLSREEKLSSMRDNFAALAAISRPGAQPQIVRSGETSLEGLVRDMLRPMLAEWIDANLPDMVEELVKAEIARIAGKRD